MNRPDGEPYNTRVIELGRHGWQALYSLPPEKAVVAAYASAKGDHNTWEWDERYATQVKKINYCYFLGNFCALTVEAQDAVDEAVEKAKKEAQLVAQLKKAR